MYTLKVKTDFSGAHSLRGYDGDCARVHGHNWKVEVEVETRELDHLGIGVDFKVLKRDIRKVVDILEHQNINEIPPFDEINPTAENLSAWIYKELRLLINNDVSKLKSVLLWETDRSSVKYSES